MTQNILLAGFGGQGILFAGKVAAYSGLMDGKEVSWLPSYGPEMRGGTANCSVCISDDPICSPLILSLIHISRKICGNPPKPSPFPEDVAPISAIFDSFDIYYKFSQTNPLTILQKLVKYRCVMTLDKGKANFIVSGGD